MDNVGGTKIATMSRRHEMIFVTGIIHKDNFKSRPELVRESYCHAAINVTLITPALKYFDYRVWSYIQ